MKNTLPDRLREQVAAMPETKYGVTRIIATLDDGTVYRDVNVAWGKDILKAGNFSEGAFLDDPYQEDSLHEYVAAIEALHVLCPDEMINAEQELMARIRQEGFDGSVVAASRSRFLKAVEYWRRETET
jgi:hypothetical protein